MPKHNSSIRCPWILEDWVMNHVFHPFPTRQQKWELAQETGNSLKSIEYWFANTRRRVIYPLQNREYLPSTVLEYSYWMVYHHLFQQIPLEMIV